MLETHVRQAATVLLETAIRVAPPHTRDWGAAMRGELNYVEGSWAGTMWALGGASVMLKQAVVSLMVPGRGAIVVPDGGLFAKNVFFRRAALAAGGACILAALLFFAAPPFRQAFAVAMKPWSLIYQVATGNLQPGIQALAKRAETERDAEGLAFCAVRLQEARESVRLAEEAVHIDPSLTWIYALVAPRSPELLETGRWLEKLRQWDPRNALFPLIIAQWIVRTQFPQGVWTPPDQKPDQKQEQAWQSAMAAAFQSPKFDDYQDRLAELNRKVVHRYRFDDPYEVESRSDPGLPSPVMEASERYALSLIRDGRELEARGDWTGAREKYWTVARFGQLVDSQGHTWLEHWSATYLQHLAYKPLKALSEKQGDAVDAALFGYLAAKFDPFTGVYARGQGESAFGLSISRRNAAVVEIAGLMILVFCGLIVIAAAILIAARRRGARPATRRAVPMATIVVTSSAVGLLFSSVTLYLTYRPYWYIFQSARLNGQSVQTRDLSEFLNSTQMLPGMSPHLFQTLLEALLYSGSPSFLFYVWTGVTLLAVSGLVLIVLRGLRSRLS